MRSNRTLTWTMTPWVLGFMPFSGCAPDSGGQENTAVAMPVAASPAGGEALCVDTARSVVRWRGSERVGDGHTGVVRLVEGRVSRDGDGFRGGHVVVDMTSIDVTDLPRHETRARAQLLSHLKHGEFFDVERFPTARLDLTRIVQEDSDGYSITGDLRVRDSAHSVTFPASVRELTSDRLHATARLVIDRWRWGVEFDGLTSPLRNALVEDEIQLDMELHASRDACPASLQQVAREPIIDDPCEGCEAVFEGIPPRHSLAWEARIAPADEPGERMRIEGIVRDPDGRPAEGIIVYAYHTDAEGVYPRMEDPPGAAAARHGRLRGWARTDAQGRYGFRTIRPVGYPDSNAPQHVHLHIIEPGCCTYYIDSIHFTDDPRLTERQRRRMGTSGRGGAGLVTPTRDAEGVWVARRDIRLGHGVPGYERFAGRA